MNVRVADKFNSRWQRHRIASTTHPDPERVELLQPILIRPFQGRGPFCHMIRGALRPWLSNPIAARLIVRAAIFFTFAISICSTEFPQPVCAQTTEKMRLGYSGTGLSNYALEMGKRLGIFRRNGIDLEVVYVNSGSLLNQALISGTFDVSLSQGSEAMLAKLRGADMRIVAVIANHFNHVYLAAPSITSFKQLKGKKVAVSRFGSGSHFQSNLALKDGGLDPDRDVTVLQIGNSGARITAI